MKSMKLRIAFKKIKMFQGLTDVLSAILNLSAPCKAGKRNVRRLPPLPAAGAGLCHLRSVRGLWCSEFVCSSVLKIEDFLVYLPVLRKYPHRIYHNG